MDATLPMDDDFYEEEDHSYDEDREGSVIGHLIQLTPQNREKARYPIRMGLNTIGRANRDRSTPKSINHIQIQDPTISSEHAKIEVKQLPTSIKLSDISRPFVTSSNDVIDLDLIQITVVGSNPSSLSDTFAASPKLSDSKVRLFKNTPRVLTHNVYVFLGPVCLKFELADFRAGVARTEAEKKSLSNNRLRLTPDVDATLAYNDSPSPDPLSNRLTPSAYARSSPHSDPDATLVVDPDADIVLSEPDFDENATQIYPDRDEEDDELNETAATLVYDAEDDIDENAATLPVDEPVHFDQPVHHNGQSSDAQFDEDDEFGETLSLNIDMDDDDELPNNQSGRNSSHRRSSASPGPLSPTFDATPSVSQREEEARRERERAIQEEQNQRERERQAQAEREREEEAEREHQAEIEHEEELEREREREQEQEREREREQEKQAEAARKTKAKRKAEADRKAEAERKAADRKIEAERKASEKRQAEEGKRKEEHDRLAAEKIETERIEVERMEAEKTKSKPAPDVSQWKTKNKRKSDDVSAASSPSKVSRSNSSASATHSESPPAPELVVEEEKEDVKPASKRASRAKPAVATSVARGKRRRAILDEDEDEEELQVKPASPPVPPADLPRLPPRLADLGDQPVSPVEQPMDVDFPADENADAPVDTTSPSSAAAPLPAISTTGANTTPDFDTLNEMPSYRNTAKKPMTKKRGRKQAEPEDEATEDDETAIAAAAAPSVRSKRRKTDVDTSEEVVEEAVVEHKKPSPKAKVARAKAAVKKETPIVKKEELDEKPAGRATRTVSRSCSSAGESPRPVSAITVDKPIILFTGIANHMDFEPDIVRLGGAITEHVEQATHLVTDKVRRTDKFLSAFSITHHLMSLQWLNESIEKDGWCDHSDARYHLKDPASEKLYGFKINNRSVGNNWLSGTSIFRTPSMPVPEAATKLIVESAGGTFLNSQPEAFDANTLIVGDAKDADLIDELCALGYRVHDKEMLLSGILRQSLDVQNHIIQEPHAGTRTKAKRGGKKR